MGPLLTGVGRGVTILLRELKFIDRVPRLWSWGLD